MRQGEFHVSSNRFDQVNSFMVKQDVRVTDVKSEFATVERIPGNICDVVLQYADQEEEKKKTRPLEVHHVYEPVVLNSIYEYLEHEQFVTTNEGLLQIEKSIIDEVGTFIEHLSYPISRKGAMLCKVFKHIMRK